MIYCCLFRGDIGLSLQVSGAVTRLTVYRADTHSESKAREIDPDDEFGAAGAAPGIPLPRRVSLTFARLNIENMSRFFRVFHSVQPMISHGSIWFFYSVAELFPSIFGL